jgi:ParB family chromosome partitioning protein
MTAAAVVQCATIPLAHLRESPFNPRTQYLDDDMGELQASIAEHGVVQPILVRPIADGTFEIIAGHRRSRAAMAAKLTDIPATVRELTDAEARQSNSSRTRSVSTSSRWMKRRRTRRSSTRA